MAAGKDQMAVTKTRERERPDVVYKDAGKDTVCMRGREIKKTDKEDMKVNGLEHVHKYQQWVIEAVHV